MRIVGIRRTQEAFLAPSAHPGARLPHTRLIGRSRGLLIP
jgi:hypothetical protein